MEEADTEGEPLADMLTDTVLLPEELLHRLAVALWVAEAEALLLLLREPLEEPLPDLPALWLWLPEPLLLTEGELEPERDTRGLREPEGEAELQRLPELLTLPVLLPDTLALELAAPESDTLVLTDLQAVALLQLLALPEGEPEEEAAPEELAL